MTDHAEPPAGGAARRTPYELVFTEGDFESSHFPQIREEAAGSLDELGRDAFDFVRAAGDLVRQVTPEDAPPEALDQYRALLFHAFHFWADDHRLLVTEPAAARFLIESAPDLSEWSFAAPGRATYIQLPPNLFWSSIAADASPEPVDGFFITVTDTPGDSALRQLDILLVLGIHRGRAGFSVIPLGSEIGAEVPNPWDATHRSGGDFSNELPGGELSGLYSLLTVGEVFKLVARICWYADQFPDARVEVKAEEVRDGEDEAPHTRLAYSRLTLGSEPAG